MKKKIDEARRMIVFTFDGLEAVVFDPSRVSAANRAYAELHGWQARLGDNAAITKGPENNFRVTEKMRREAILELVEYYYGDAQEWNVKRAEGKREVFNPHIQALAEKLGKTYEEAQAWFAAKLEAELAAE